ncbi:hypothetical protein ABEB22_21160 (plasmid) [Thioclava sp. 'Guangxiensis']|uniref:hypothetical protein n=1 Tax=Thioclava sp. 'Guangxiensis' TaxID=3149044 RepID=UPI0032C41D76
MGGISGRRTALFSGALLLGVLSGMPVLLPGAAMAQEIEGSHSALGLSMGIEAGRNLDLESDNEARESRLNTALSYRLSRQTARASLDLGSNLRWYLEDGGEDVFLPRLNGAYRLEGARSRLTLGLGYTRTEVTDQSVSYDDTGTLTSYDGTGLRSVLNGSAGFEGGIDAPLGYSLGYRHTDVSYDGTRSGSFSASTRDFYDLGLRLTPDALGEVRLDLHHDRYRVDNSTRTERLTSRITLSGTRRLDAITRLSLGVGYSEIDTTRTTIDSARQGMGFSLGVVRDDPLGHSSASLSRALTASGQRDELVIGRVRTLKTGRLEGLVGLSRSDRGSLDWIASLDWVSERPRDTLRVGLTRRISSDNDNNDVVVTRVNGTLSHKFGEASSLRLALQASLQDNETGASRQRASASLSYLRQLTRETRLDLGLRKEYSRNTSDRTANSEVVFVTLERDLDFLH